MTVRITKIYPTADLTNTSTAIGTAVAAGVSQVIKRAVFNNHDTSTPRSVTVYVVASAGSATAANQIITAKVLQPGEAYVSPELAGLELIAGDQLYALADTASKVNLTISGITVS